MFVLMILAYSAVLVSCVPKVSFFAIIVLQLYHYYKCPVALPHGVVVWSAVCDCGIS